MNCTSGGSPLSSNKSFRLHRGMTVWYMYTRVCWWRWVASAAGRVAGHGGGARRPGAGGPAPSPRHTPPPQEQTRQSNRRKACARPYCAGAATVFLMRYCI